MYQTAQTLHNKTFGAMLCLAKLSAPNAVATVESQSR
jgi:hypothetical protein